MPELSTAIISLLNLGPKVLVRKKFPVNVRVHCFPYTIDSTLKSLKSEEGKNSAISGGITFKSGYLKSPLKIILSSFHLFLLFLLFLPPDLLLFLLSFLFCFS